jgi:hypothetical protein
VESTFRSDVYPLVRRSYLYNLLWAIRGGWEGPTSRSEEYVLADGTRVMLRPNDWQASAARARPGRAEFDMLMEALTHLRDIAKAQNAETVAVLQPGKEEVYLSLRGQRADLTVDLRRAFDAGHVRYVDLGPEFRAAAAGGQHLYREVDGHPNEAGYRVIADRVGAYLTEHGRELGLEPVRK